LIALAKLLEMPVQITPSARKMQRGSCGTALAREAAGKAPGARELCEKRALR
jgi:hypothetical protein